MRINFLLPTANMSGGIRVVGIYAQVLVQRGHRVILVSQPPSSISVTTKLKSALRGRGWPRQDKTHRSHLSGLELDHRILERRRPPTDGDVPDGDVVIASWWKTAEWVNALSERKGAKAYFIQHHEVHEHLPVERVKATYGFPLHKIVVAQWLRDVMLSEYGDRAVDLVPNSVDHGLFFADPRGKQLRPTIGFLYSRAAFKGVDTTIKATTELRNRFPDLRVISFGSAVPAGDSPLDEIIEFHYAPEQHVIRDLYAQCDVWVTASRSEGFNLPAMEAMACRTPVVSTKTGWPAEAINASHNGFLVEIDDAAGMVDAVESILSLSDERWRRMSENAYATVASSTWEQSAADFEKALEHACGRAERGEITGRPSLFGVKE